MNEEKSLDRNSSADVLYKLVIALASKLELEDLYQNIVTVGCELANTTHGFLAVANTEQAVMELKYGTGMYTWYTGVVESKAKSSVSAAVWNTGQILLVDTLNQEEGRATDPSSSGELVKTVLGIPLHSGYEVIAVIGLGFDTVKSELSNGEIQLLSRFATLAALAVNNSRLYNALNTELLVQKQINKVQKAIMEQQINLYCQELVSAQTAGVSQAELPVRLANHYTLARRMRRTTQLHLADIYIESSQQKIQCQNHAHKFVETFTCREKVVLCLIATGLSNQEIAQEMGVTINTVKTHANHLFNKLGVTRRAQALVKAREIGLL